MASFKKSLIYLHIFVFLAGLTGPLGHLISLSGLHLVLYRMGLTSLVVLIIKFFSKTHSITWKQRIQLIGIGVLISIHWACFFASIKLSNVSIALVCFSSTGLFTVLLEPIFTKHSFSLIDFLIGGLMKRLIYLTKGLSLILAFIGVKLIIEAFHGMDIHYIGSFHIPEIALSFSLSVIISILAITTIASLAATKGKN